MLGIGFLSMTSAQTFTEWQDADINAVNRLPMRATKFAYESVATAAVGDKNASGASLRSTAYGDSAGHVTLTSVLRISSARTTTTEHGARCPYRACGS